MRGLFRIVGILFSASWRAVPAWPPPRLPGPTSSSSWSTTSAGPTRAATAATFTRRPNIDRLAHDGMRFTQSLLRLHRLLADAGLPHDRQVPGPAAHHRLDSRASCRPTRSCSSPTGPSTCRSTEMTIADVFQRPATRPPVIGKWHLGGRDFYPEKHGFDLNVAGTDGRSPARATSRPGRSRPSPKGRTGRISDRPAGRRGREVHRAVAGAGRSSCTFRTTPSTRRSRAGPTWWRSTRRSSTPGLTHTNAGYAAMIESMDADRRPGPRASSTT